MLVLESFDGIGRRTSFGVDNARACAREAVERVLDHWESFGEFLLSSRFKPLTNRLNTLALMERASLATPVDPCIASGRGLFQANAAVIKSSRLIHWRRATFG